MFHPIRATQLLVQFQFGIAREPPVTLENSKLLHTVWWSNRLEPTTISASFQLFWENNLSRA
jgi:hypothetical protein